MSFVEDLECFIETNHYDLMMMSKTQQAIINRAIIADLQEKNTPPKEILEMLCLRFDSILQEATHLMERDNSVNFPEGFEFKSAPVS